MSAQRQSLVFFCLLFLLAVFPAANGHAAQSGSKPVTQVRITGNESQTVAVTFGQPFADGDVPRGQTVVLRAEDKQDLPTQVDVKARHPDGAVRHAILSARVPKGIHSLEIFTVPEKAATPPALSAKAALPGDKDVVLALTLADKTYRLSVKTLLAENAGAPWLAGGIVHEWRVVAPLRDSLGKEHPHLFALFDVRTYAGSDIVRVDTIVEHPWPFVPGPKNETYDAAISVGGSPVFTKKAMVHTPRVRWHKVIYIVGKEHAGIAALDRGYLETTGAVPTYDPNLRIAPKALDEWAAKSAALEPLGLVFLTRAMGTTGGRPDIGILPAWQAGYVVSNGDSRAHAAVIALGDAGGSFPTHMRDKATLEPLTIKYIDDLTILGNPGDTKHPFAPCAEKDACRTDLQPDSAHQPSLGYLAYLISGDRFYLDELEFYAGWNVYRHHPAYRQFGRGLTTPEQPRGQAWNLRTLAQVAYIAPDNDPLKKHFNYLLGENLREYAVRFKAPDKNALNLNLTSPYVFAYAQSTGVATWQDDFFTSAVSYLVGLGFSEAKPLLDFKAKNPVERMINPDYCWIAAAPYQFIIRDSQNSPFYTQWKKIFAATNPYRSPQGKTLADFPCGGAEMAAFISASPVGNGRRPFVPGEMLGYADSPTGYPANLQPALAAAVDSGIPGSRQAWEKFISRPVKPDYSSEPQFAIFPRKQRPAP